MCEVSYVSLTENNIVSSVNTSENIKRSYIVVIMCKIRHDSLKHHISSGLNFTLFALLTHFLTFS